MSCDEFEIKAFDSNKNYRIWTRNSLSSALNLAQQVLNQGYNNVEVVNIFGGHRSDNFYNKN